MYEVLEHNKEDATLKNVKKKVIYILWKQKVKQFFLTESPCWKLCADHLWFWLLMDESAVSASPIWILPSNSMT